MKNELLLPFGNLIQRRTPGGGGGTIFGGQWPFVLKQWGNVTSSYQNNRLVPSPIFDQVSAPDLIPNECLNTAYYINIFQDFYTQVNLGQHNYRYDSVQLVFFCFYRLTRTLHHIYDLFSSRLLCNDLRLWIRSRDEMQKP